MKLKSVKILLFGFFLMVAIGFMNTSVYAETMTPDKIQGPAYVIGSHVFTRDINETTGYEGRITTNLIMLASKTIESSDLEDMIIYYKTATGMWINGLTGSVIEPPTSFDINYTNLQLEEINSTVSEPKVPILEFHAGPRSIDDETDMMTYLLGIHIDDIDDKTKKVDGVELSIVDYNSHVTNQDISEFPNITTVSENYTGDVLSIGKKYHTKYINFDCPPDGYYSITAKAYALDANGKKTYSDSVYVSINPETTFPTVEIVNKYEYSNPDYVAFDGDFYTYRLGIKKPEAYVYEVSPERFEYTVYEECIEDGKTVDVRIVDVCGLNDDFTITVPKECVRKYYAILRYCDSNGEWHMRS